MRHPREMRRTWAEVFAATCAIATLASCKAAPSPTRFVEQQDAVVEVVLAEVGAFPDGPTRISRALGSRYERVRKRAELATTRLRARGILPLPDAGGTAADLTQRKPLSPGLESQDPLARQSASLVLGRDAPAGVENSEAVARLLEALKTEKDERARWAMVWAVGKLAPELPEVRSALEPLLHDPNLFAAAFAECALKGSPGFRLASSAPLHEAPDLALVSRILFPSLRNPKVELRIAGRGELMLELFPFEAPLHVAAFVKVVSAGGLEGRRIARVDPFAGVLIARSSSATRVPDETWSRPCLRGCVLSPDEAPGTMYIASLPLPDADGRLAVWGRVALGLAVIDTLREGDSIESVQLLDPLGRPWRLPPSNP